MVFLFCKCSGSYCVQHQRALKTDVNEVGTLQGKVQHQAEEVHPGSELGISNDLNKKCTVVLISRFCGAGDSLQTVVPDVLRIFDKLDVSVLKTSIEVSEDKIEKHLYLLQEAASKDKLGESNVRSAREMLSALLGRLRQSENEVLVDSV